MKFMSVFFAGLLHVAYAGFVHAQPAVIPDVDLKLFEKSEVDLSKGCSVSLWQANRDPETDKFAYIFLETLTGKNHTRTPARIKVGTEVVTATRVAVGGKSPGYGLHPYQLYKLPNADEFVILDLKLGEEMGEAVEIESGTMSIVMKGKQVFRASVKGGSGCMTPPAAEQPAKAAPAKAAPVPPKRTEAPSQTNNDMAGMFQRYDVRANQVPRVMTQAAIKQFGCEAAMLRGKVIGYQMSEESAIWQLPCGDYGTTKSAVFALVYLTDPAAQYSFIPFKFPKGKSRGLGDNAMMEPRWDLKTRMVTSIYTEGNGKDCGSWERHRVNAEGEFELVELRARDMCDGKSVGAENFPVVFKAK
jgi:hypothetical protein